MNYLRIRAGIWKVILDRRKWEMETEIGWGKTAQGGFVIGCYKGKPKRLASLGSL